MKKFLFICVILIVGLVLLGAGCVRQKKSAVIAPQAEQKSTAEPEKEQMFAAAREYVKKYSVEGMEVDLEVIKQLDKWVLLRVIPLNIETDIAAIVLEKVDGNWVPREFGTILPESIEKVPELFE